MPSIVEYDRVLARMTGQGMRCLYHNSGAFGLQPGVEAHYAGWIGPEDSTIRPEARRRARQVPAPHEATLASLTTRAWLEMLAGPAWVMPKSHWAHDLDLGGKAWMSAALQNADIDPMRLATLNNAAAIEFMPHEAERFTRFVQTLLEKLLGSDFAVVFPVHPIVCTLHHHKQIWWVTGDASLLARIDGLLTT
ncbi:MAG: hypothetical protein JWO87_2326 [Phycisphaerales bacterium]|nr:hypothetical protein [Phycisphaerales bacterium]MDB5300663.1 hypothetical protein [Phycisphaerales bacterium]